MDLSRLVNIVLFGRIDIGQVYIAPQHPSLRRHAAEYMLFTLASPQVRFVVVRCDSRKVPTSSSGMAREGVVARLGTVVELSRALFRPGSRGVEEFDCAAKEGPDVWEIGHVDADRGFSEVPELIRGVVDIAEREDLGYDGANDLPAR